LRSSPPYPLLFLVSSFLTRVSFRIALGDLRSSGRGAYFFFLLSSRDSSSINTPLLAHFYKRNLVSSSTDKHPEYYDPFMHSFRNFTLMELSTCPLLTLPYFRSPITTSTSQDVRDFFLLTSSAALATHTHQSRLSQDNQMSRRGPMPIYFDRFSFFPSSQNARKSPSIPPWLCRDYFSEQSPDLRIS